MSHPQIKSYEIRDHLQLETLVKMHAAQRQKHHKLYGQ